MQHGADDRGRLCLSAQSMSISSSSVAMKAHSISMYTGRAPVLLNTSYDRVHLHFLPDSTVT